jgi:mannose-6-phosphate isomerase-like protein (cupin superfamily)
MGTHRALRMRLSNQAIERVEKPWGYELIWAKTADYVGKLLHINRGHKLSLQYHEKEEETIFVSSGRMTLIFETLPRTLEEILLSAGQAYHIPIRRRHRMIALEDCDVVEVSTSHLDHVVRVDDAYGRVGTSKP